MNGTVFKNAAIRTALVFTLLASPVAAQKQIDSLGGKLPLVENTVGKDGKGGKINYGKKYPIKDGKKGKQVADKNYGETQGNTDEGMEMAENIGSNFGENGAILDEKGKIIGTVLHGNETIDGNDNILDSNGKIIGYTEKNDGVASYQYYDKEGKKVAYTIEDYPNGRSAVIVYNSDGSQTISETSQDGEVISAVKFDKKGEQVWSTKCDFHGENGKTIGTYSGENGNPPQALQKGTDGSLWPSTLRDWVQLVSGFVAGCTYVLVTDAIMRIRRRKKEKAGKDGAIQSRKIKVSQL